MFSFKKNGSSKMAKSWNLPFVRGHDIMKCQTSKIVEKGV